MILNNIHEKSKFSNEDRKEKETSDSAGDKSHAIEGGVINTNENFNESSLMQRRGNNKSFSNRMLRLSLGVLSTNVLKENISEGETNKSQHDSNSSSPLRYQGPTDRSSSPENANFRPNGIYTVSQSPLRHAVGSRGSKRKGSDHSFTSCTKNKNGSIFMHQSAQEHSSRNSNVWDPSMGSKIIWTLKRDLKTKEDAEYIHQMIKDFPFFSRFVTQNLGDLEEGAILQLCKHMKYETISAGEYVFKEGDLSNDKLYIILSGKVHILFSNDRNVFFKENLVSEEAIQIKNPRKMSKNSHLTQIEPKGPLTMTPLQKRVSSIATASGNTPLLHSSYKKNDPGLFMTDLEPDMDLPPPSTKLSRSKSKKLSVVKPNSLLAGKDLTEGEAFGEKALTSKDSKRSASIYASVDCQFIILMKEDYLSIVGKYHKENRFKLNFLKENLPYVDRITSTLILEDFLYIFNTEFYKRGNTIIEEGKPGTKVYLLVQGECIVEKKIMQEKSDIPKTVFIAKVSAPAMLGEEIVYQKRSEREYIYTVKTDSLDAKLYYCQVNALKYRFPKETLQKLRESYIEKERVRAERLNFVQNIEQQSVNQKDMQEVKPGYQEIIKMAAKGCRSSFFVRPRPTSSSEQKNPPAERPTDDIEKSKHVIDSYSRAYSSIRKKIIAGVQSSLDDYYKSTQYDELSIQNPSANVILPSGGQTDRPTYETQTSRIEGSTKLNQLGESVESCQTLTRWFLRDKKIEEPKKSQVETQLKLPGEDKPLKESFKELVAQEKEKRATNLRHRRTKSDTEPSSQSRFSLLGPKKKIAPESVFNKRHYVIRKSNGSENPNDLENQAKTDQTTNGDSVQPFTGFGDLRLPISKYIAEKAQLLQKKKEEAKDEIIPSKDFEKACYLKKRLLTLSSLKESPLLFSRLTRFVSSKNRISTNQDHEIISIRSSFGGKIGGGSIAPFRTLTTTETPRSIMQRQNPLTERQKVLVADEIKSVDKSPKSRSIERPSPLITDGFEEDKIIFSPNYDLRQSFNFRTGGKATSVKNLQEKSKQMKALHSKRKAREESKKISSLYERSCLINKDNKDL